MGERDNHIDQGTSLSPEGNYSHMDMVRGRVVDGEVQPGEDEGDDDVHGGGGAHGHGHGHGPWGQRPWPFLLPWRWCYCKD